MRLGCKDLYDLKQLFVKSGFNLPHRVYKPLGYSWCFLSWVITGKLMGASAPTLNLDKIMTSVPKVVFITCELLW
jgi:hypothetical protein